MEDVKRELGRAGRGKWQKNKTRQERVIGRQRYRSQERKKRVRGKRNGEEFRGSQTFCTPSTADATFCLAQWSVGLCYLYPCCVTSGLTQYTHRTRTREVSKFCSSPAWLKWSKLEGLSAWSTDGEPQCTHTYTRLLCDWKSLIWL